MLIIIDDYADDDDACISCEEGWGEPNECADSKRPCGHHCNHMCTDDECCWCGETLPGPD